ncbi:MAG: hypothetical protein K2X82_07570 [Gemmataceae bacterium]|nr:hypothetical protein [Gemmataceae bacterium]
MRAGTFALVGLVMGTAAAADPAPEFKPFASAAGRYKVLFPGAVKTETTEVKTPAGPANLTLDTVNYGGVTFLVSHVDVPDAVAQLPPGPRLDKVRDAHKGADGRVLADKELTVGDEKHPARDVLVDKPGGALRARVVIAGSRLYQVMAQGPRELVSGEAADRFFLSFEVTK